MDIRVAKHIIGKKVKYGDHAYILTACILRKNDQGYHYQAELRELKANCVYIVALDDVEEVNSDGKM